MYFCREDGKAVYESWAVDRRGSCEVRVKSVPGRGVWRVARLEMLGVTTRCILVSAALASCGR